MEETATWCCTHTKKLVSSSTYSTCGRLVSPWIQYPPVLQLVLFCIKCTKCTFSNSTPLNLTLCLFSIRAAMPLQMRSLLAPTRLSTLITSTMEPRFRSGWSWERSPATSWLFSKENSSSLRWDFFHQGDLQMLGWEKVLVFNFGTKLMVLILQNCGEILFPKREAVVPLMPRKT